MNSRRVAKLTIPVLFVLGIGVSLMLVARAGSSRTASTLDASRSPSEAGEEVENSREYESLVTDADLEEKRAILQGRDSREQVPLGNAQVERWNFEGDKGDLNEIEGARSAVKVLEERLASGYQMPGPTERGLGAKVVADASERKSEVASSFQSVVDEVYASEAPAKTTDRALRRAYDDPQYRGYTDNKFVVDEWLGVELDGETARALLLAHQEYLTNPAKDTADEPRWTIDPVRKWQISLVRQGGEWKIYDQSQLSVSSSGQG